MKSAIYPFLCFNIYYKPGPLSQGSSLLLHHSGYHLHYCTCARPGHHSDCSPSSTPRMQESSDKQLETHHMTWTSDLSTTGSCQPIPTRKL